LYAAHLLFNHLKKIYIPFKILFLPLTNLTDFAQIFSIYKGVKILGKHPCGYRGGDPMVVGFITTYAISAYHQ
jgi:hypothetical protein